MKKVNPKRKIEQNNLIFFYHGYIKLNFNHHFNNQNCFFKKNYKNLQLKFDRFMDYGGPKCDHIYLGHNQLTPKNLVLKSI